MRQMIHGMLCAWTAHFLTCKWAAIQRQMWVLWSIERVMVTEAIFTFEDAQAFTWWEAPLLLYRLLLKVFCDISGENKGAQQEEWNLSLVYLSRKPWCRGSSVLRVRHLMPLPVPEPRTGDQSMTWNSCFLAGLLGSRGNIFLFLPSF